MKSWSIIVVLALFALSSALPVPEDDTSKSATSAEEKTSVIPEDVDDVETKNNSPRSIPDNDAIISEMNPSERITQALENVSKTLRMGIKNLGNSAIQILEGTGVATEQALGTGARIVTGVAETAAEAAETGAKSAIRIANGVANSLSQSTKVLVDTKTQLLKGLTGASASALQADASSNSESVQRNERANTGGYSSGYPSTSYGPNTVAETPNNFLNVFSQAAANTVNFGTQLLNSLVGVAANILQGTVSTLLSLLNAKGQVVGAVVQSAPPVLASVTRTAGDVLAAKARIFGAVTQGLARLFIEVLSEAMNTLALVKSKAKDSKARVLTASGKALRISVGATTRGIQSVYEAAVSFGSQLARVFGDTFSGLLNRQGGESGSTGSPLAQIAQLFSGLSSRGSGSSSGLSGSGSSGANLLGGVGNFAQTVINSKLNLLNGLLAPFTGGRPLLNFGNRGSSSSSSSSGLSSSSSSGYSEPNFRISIASASTPNSVSASSSDSSTKSSSGPRTPRFYLSPEATPKTTDGHLTSSNLIATFKSGVFKGIVDQFNSDLQTRIKKLTSSASSTSAQRNSFLGSANRENGASSFSGTSLFAPLINPKASSGLTINSKENNNNGLDFLKILPLAFANANQDYFNFNN